MLPAPAQETVNVYSAAEHKKAQSRMDASASLIAKLASTVSAPQVTTAATTSPASIPKSVAGKGGKLLDWLKQAGFQGEELRKAWAVAMRESNGNPSSFNGNAKTGDKSYGLFQINMLGSMGPARLKAFGLSSESQLLDPVINAKAAYKMSRGGWGAWDIDPSGYNYKNNRASWQQHYNAYKKYYDMFPTAVGQSTLTAAAARKISK